MTTSSALVRLRRLLEAERAQPTADRNSKASDDQLDWALAEVARAETVDGSAAASAEQLAQLAHVVSDTWPFSSVGAELLGYIQALRRG